MKIKKLLCIFLSILLLLPMAMLLSISMAGVVNPVLSTWGLLTIMFTDTPYVQLQSYPQVIMAQPDYSLVEYMAEQGFQEDEEARLGGLRCFTQGERDEQVMYSVNRYYSLWCWQ